MLKTIDSLFSAFSQFDLASRDSVIVAVSGGSDSTALLLLLQKHLLDRAAGTRPVAVTVDHGLRAASADEAVAVAQLCAAHGIEHRIVRWAGPKPSSGIPAAARGARYRLLAEAAREAGTDIVLTGHTADDQAETVLMRKARGDGPGLAGMAFVTLYEGDVWLVRPLLRDRRALLREYIDRRGVSWTEDATNADERFERPRARAQLGIGQAGAAGLAGDEQTSALLALATRAGQERCDLSHRAATIVTERARRAAPGLLHLDASFARCPDRDAALHALRVLIATAGGSEHLPPAGQAGALLARLASPPFRGTLSRALVAARRDGVWLARETRSLPEPQIARDGMIWDGRYRLRIEGDDRGDLRIAARGPQAMPPADVAGDRLPPSLARAAAAGRPVISIPDGRLDPTGNGLPRGVALLPVVSPHARFMPGFDFEVVRAVGELIGAPPLPRPPFASHKQG